MVEDWAGSQDTAALGRQQVDRTYGTLVDHVGLNVSVSATGAVTLTSSRPNGGDDVSDELDDFWGPWL